MARAVLYKFLSRVFSYPRERIPEEILNQVQWSAGVCGVSRAFRLFLRRLKLAEPSELEEEYIRALGHVSNSEAPAYETGYGAAHAFQQTTELGDIAAFYRSQGLRPVGEERLDHISPELEFMAFLVFKETQSPDQVEITRDIEKKFLQDHLGRWAPVFAKRLQQRQPPPGTYGLGASALNAFLKSEFAELGAAPQAARHVDTSPVRFGPDGACFTCGADPESPQTKPEEML
jgi:TorA maturation chaperone TorD